MAENPVLGWSDTLLYPGDRVPRMGGEGPITSIVDSAIEVGGALSEGSLLADLQEADAVSAEEMAQRRAAIDAEAADVLGSLTDEEQQDPEFQTAVKELTRLALAEKQGKLDATGVAVRREQVLRKHIARRPYWASRLIEAANDHIGGSTLGQAIKDSSTSPSQQFNDIRDNGTKLGVDPAMWTYAPAQAAKEYITRARRESVVQGARQKVEVYLATGQVLENYDQSLGILASEDISNMVGQIQTALSSPQAMNAATRGALMENIRNQVGLHRAQAIQLFARATQGQVPLDQASRYIPQLALYDYIASEAEPERLVKGVQNYLNAEVSGFYLTRPGAFIDKERIEMLAKIDAINPELLRGHRDATARITGSFLRMLDEVGTNTAVPGPAAPDASGAVLDPNTSSTLSFEQTKQAYSVFKDHPQVMDKLLEQRAMEYNQGRMPSKTEVAYLSDVVASDEYRKMIESSSVPIEVRQERSTQIAQMLATEFYVPTEPGQPALNWTRGLDGIKWENGRATFLGEYISEEGNSAISPRLTALVRAIAHLSGSKDYASSSAMAWEILKAVSVAE